MAYACPTFLFQNRFGMYYFRCRIPQSIRNKYQSTKAEIRKSLSTKDYRTALDLARRLWVKMIDNDFFLASSITIKEVPIQAVPIVDHQHPPEVKIIGSSKAFIERESQGESQDDVCLSDLVDKYCEENRHRWGVTFEYKDVRPVTSILVELIGDKCCSSIQLQDIVKFKEVYIQLPKNRKKLKRYRDKSVPQLLELEIPEQDRLSLTTMKKSFNMLITFITWCSDNHFLSIELARPLQRFNKQNTKAEREYEERDPFDDGDLKKIFGSKEYCEGSHNRASEYWLPLIALFSGCRLREICQFYKEDIRYDSESGVYYFDISADADKGKRVKTKSSKRQIPIHRKLIELGFLDYVAKVREGRPIFREITKTNIENKSHYLSKWFGRYRKRCMVGVKAGEKKTFHSFRHTVCNHLKSKGVSIDLIEEITGHTDGRASQTKTRYTLPYDLGIKSKTISVLDYESVIDFVKIRKRW